MITVLMSVYNERIEWIKQSINSMLDQTYTDIEIFIVIDNPNLDKDCKDYLLNVAKNDKRVTLVWNEKNIGLASSLNKGILLSKGEYIARMDADDISFPNRLEKELDFLISKDYDIVSANKIDIDEDGAIIRKEKINEKDPNKVIEYSNIIVHPLVMMKKTAVTHLGGYRLLKNSEDYDLWLRMTDAGYKFGILDDYLLYYRVRSNSASVERLLEQYYVTKYVRYLHQERKKEGNDSFSVEQQEEYLSRCNFSDSMKRKIARSQEYIRRAMDNLHDHRYIYGLFLMCVALYYCPVLFFDKFKNHTFERLKMH